MYRGNRPPSEGASRGRGRPPQARTPYPQRFQNPQQQQNFRGAHAGHYPPQNNYPSQEFNSARNQSGQGYPQGRYSPPRRNDTQRPEQRYRDRSSTSSYYANDREDYYPDYSSRSPGPSLDKPAKEPPSVAPPVGDFTEDVVEDTFSEYPPLISSSQVHNRNDQNPEKNKNEVAGQPPLDAFVSRLLDSFDSDEDDESAARRRPVHVNLPPPPKGILKKSTTAVPAATSSNMPESGGMSKPSRVEPKSITSLIHEIREKTGSEKEVKETDKNGENFSRIEVLTSQRQKTVAVVSKSTPLATQPSIVSALTEAAVIAASGATLNAFGALPLTNLHHALDELRRGQFQPQNAYPQRERDLDVAVQEFLDKGKTHLPDMHPEEGPPLRRPFEQEPGRPTRRPSPLLHDERAFVNQEPLMRREGPGFRREEPAFRREEPAFSRNEPAFGREDLSYRREEPVLRRSPSPVRRTQSFDEPVYDDFHRERERDREHFQRSAGVHRSPPRHQMGSPGRDWSVERDREFRVVRNLNDGGYPDRPRRRLSAEMEHRFSRSPQRPGSRSRDWEEYDHPSAKRLRSESPRSFSPICRRRISPPPPEREFSPPRRSRSPFFDDYSRRRRSPRPDVHPPPPETHPPPAMGSLPTPSVSHLPVPSNILPTPPSLLSLPLVAPPLVKQGLLPTPEVRRQVRREISPPAGRNVVLRERSQSPWEDRPVTPPRVEVHTNPQAPPPPEKIATAAENKEEEEKRKGFILQRKKHLAKQQKLINELFRLQTQQADLVMKQTRAVADREISRHGQLIVENAKLQKGVTLQIQTLQKVITRLESSLREGDLRESIEAPMNPTYAYFDPEQHWCSKCDTFHATMKDYLIHKHTKAHQLKDTNTITTPWRGALKEEQDKQAKAAAEQSKKILVPVHGLDFLRAVKAWYCELCDHWLGDLECANVHLNSTLHNDKYLKYIMENPEMEATHSMKRQLAFQRDLERRKQEKVGREKKEEEEKMKRKEELQKNWEEFIQKEQRRNQNVTELDDCQEKKPATPVSEPATKSIRVNMRNLSGKTEPQTGDTKPAAGNDISEWTAQSVKQDVVDKQTLESLREKIKKKQPPQEPTPSGSSSTTLRQEDRIEKTSSMPLPAKPVDKPQPIPRAPITIAEVKKPAQKQQQQQPPQSKPAQKPPLPTVGPMPSKKAQEIKLAAEDFIVLSEFNASSDEDADPSRQSDVVEIDLT